MLEYQQHSNNAFVQLGWQPFQNCPSAAPLHMQIFPTSDLSGDPSVASTCVSAVREHWGQHPWLGPELGVRDQFSARWVGNVDFIPHPAYVFSSFADDGSRLFIDDMLVLNKWDQCCQAFSSAPVDITGTSMFGSAVTKLLRYEIHDMGGLAFAYLSWAPIESQPLSSWHADESYVETVAITSGADDIEIWGTNAGPGFASSIDTSSSDLELVVDGSRNPQTVALLFRDIQVDKNAVILAASVQFHADESQSEVTNLAVRAVSCSDGHCPNSLPSSAPVRLEVSNAGGVFDNHALTASAVQWSNVPAWTVDSHETSTQAEAAQRTPDLQTVTPPRSTWLRVCLILAFLC